ncbi:unnamed protein product, partial [Musa textilis]
RVTATLPSNPFASASSSPLAGSLASLLYSPPLRRWPSHLIFAASAVLAVACVFPALALAARDVAGVKRWFVAQGRVFCDTCRAGFETPASTNIRGAKVRIKCRSKVIGSTVCSFEGTTDHTGTYNILVANEHENGICESVLISSPASRCKTALQVVRGLKCSSPTSTVSSQTRDMQTH